MNGLEQDVAALARELPRLNTAEACARISRLRRAAQILGCGPAASVCAGLGEALGRDRRATPVAAWLDALALAAGCGAGDAETAPTLLATVGVRMAG